MSDTTTADSTSHQPLGLPLNDQLGQRPKRDVVGLLRNLERHGEDNIWRTAKEAREEIQRLRAELQYARDGLTKGRSRMREDLERHKPLVQAVDGLLDDGHMNTEHLARLRAAWEAALGPNAEVTGLGRNRSNDER